MYQFPKDFFWGAATSAYQVEGNNSHSDWSEWEKRAGLKEVSAEACRHYQLYKEDFDLAKGLNHNAHRLSIEWSRIEPEDGEFSSSEIDHYQEVIRSLRERGLEPVVTLHHFTNPAWFGRLGAWQDHSAPDHFLRYTQKIVEALSDQVRFWVTINEPMVYLYHGYILGIWPPQEKSFSVARNVMANLVTGHIRAYRLIHEIYKKKNLPVPYVSIAQNIQAFVPCQNTIRNRFAVYLRNKYYNLEFLRRLIRYRSLDFLGINYYSRSLVETRGWGIKNLILDVCTFGHSKLQKNSLGWDIYPQGLYDELLALKRYNLPIFILENGICTADDNLRWDFIYAHLQKISLAMQQGVKILGYFYWSLLDNYEWDKGFGPRFGLIDIDYATYKRTVRESGRRFAEVCKIGRLP